MNFSENNREFFRSNFTVYFGGNFLLDAVNHNAAAHGEEEELELYTLSRLAPDRVARLEEHLLMCGDCRTALDKTVLYQRALREGFAPRGLAATAELPPKGWFDWLSAPVFALAALLLVAVASWVVSRSPGPGAPLAVIELVAMRGGITVAEPARETDLRLKDAGDFFGMVEVVDENGGKIWDGPVAPGGLLRIRNPLKEGAYFVRLYDRGKLIHEYGFRVRRN